MIAEAEFSLGRVVMTQGVYQHVQSGKLNPADLPPVDVPIRSGSPGSRLLDGYVG